MPIATRARASIAALIAGSGVALSATALTQAPIDARAFETRATFAVNDLRLSLSTAVATIEPAATSPRHWWVRMYFYAFPLTPAEMQEAMTGTVARIDRRWAQLPPSRYNSSRAVVQLTVDRESRAIAQVDMSVPGHTCTIAWRADDLDRFSRDYSFSGTRLRITNAGSNTCDIGSARETFTWNVDVDIPVFTVKAR